MLLSGREGRASDQDTWTGRALVGAILFAAQGQLLRATLY